MRYGVLFDIELWHDFHLNLGEIVHEALAESLREAALRQYRLADFLEVSPTQETERALAGHRLLFRTSAQGLRVGVRLDALAVDQRPVVPPAASLRLRFALKVVDSSFFNYTPLPGGAPSFYRFGNALPNRTVLSRPVPGFEPSRAYEAGEVYGAPSGATIDLFRALRDTGPSGAPNAADWVRLPPDTWDPGATYAEGALILAANRLYRALVDSPGSNLNDATEWQALLTLPNQYVTSADRLRLVADTLELDLTSAATAEATLRVFAEGESEPSLERLYTSSAGPLGVVQLSLGRLESGAHRVEVLDASLSSVAGLGFDFYLDPDAGRENWLGVIELGLGSGAAAWLDATGALRSPRYQLRFLNRATRWRYIFPKAQPVGAGADVSPLPGDARVLVTTETIPLTRFGSGLRLQADSPATPATSEEVLLPRAEPRLVRRESAEWFSDIHASNVQL